MASLDGRVINTFRNLATRPGFLTAEFLAGRRTRYLQPLRVFLLSGVFALLVLQLAGGVELGVSAMVATLFGGSGQIRVIAGIIVLVLAGTFAHRIAFNHTGRVLTEHAVLTLHLVSVLLLLSPVELVATRALGLK